MDLRLPIGYFFLLLAALLMAAALGGSGPRLNVTCGAVMAVFGAAMLWLARRKA